MLPDRNLRRDQGVIPAYFRPMNVKTNAQATNTAAAIHAIRSRDVGACRPLRGLIPGSVLYETERRRGAGALGTGIAATRQTPSISFQCDWVPSE